MSELDALQAAHKRIDNLTKKVNRNRFILSFVFGYTFRDLANVPEWLLQVLKSVILNL